MSQQPSELRNEIIRQRRETLANAGVDFDDAKVVALVLREVCRKGSGFWSGSGLTKQQKKIIRKQIKSFLPFLEEAFVDPDATQPSPDDPSNGVDDVAKLEDQPTDPDKLPPFPIYLSRDATRSISLEQVIHWAMIARQPVYPATAVNWSQEQRRAFIEYAYEPESKPNADAVASFYPDPYVVYHLSKSYDFRDFVTDVAQAYRHLTTDTNRPSTAATEYGRTWDVFRTLLLCVGIQTNPAFFVRLSHTEVLSLVEFCRCRFNYLEAVANETADDKTPVAGPLPTGFILDGNYPGCVEILRTDGTGGV
jgi:hypothetical protein